MAEFGRQLAEQYNQPGSAGRTDGHCGCRVPPRCRACGFGRESRRIDLVLPIVAGWHHLGALGMAGLDELEEHAYNLGQLIVLRHSGIMSEFPPIPTEDVRLWLVHQPLAGNFGHKSPGYYQITRHQSLEAALEHAGKLLAAGCRVDGLWDRANSCVMDEAAMAAKRGSMSA
jgi:hypothetical protein